MGYNEEDKGCRGGGQGVCGGGGGEGNGAVMGEAVSVSVC